MAELVRHHPLEAWEAAFAALPESFQVSVEPYVTVTNVRGPAPMAPNTWNEQGIWLGPDERLVVGDPAPEGTDVSAQRIILRLSGSRVRDVLSKGCSIDLHPRVFTPGRSAQTSLGQAAVVLLADEQGFVVHVRSSFAGYLADWLLDASLEYV